jgi:cytochrome c oxidase subunit IV
MAEKRSSARVYVLVWLGLCALTLLSFLLSLFNLGEAEMPLALLIAAAKSSLVGLYFMHILEDRLRTAVVPIVTTGFVVLLVSLVVTDVLTRHTFPKTPVPAGWPEGLAPPPPVGPQR